MKELLLLLLIVSVTSLNSCKTDEITKVVDIDRIDTTGVYFSYKYLDEVYNGSFSLDISVEDFTSADRLKIIFNKDTPGNYKFISVVYRKWKKEDVSVDIKNISGSKETIYSLRSLDQKPLFKGANDEYDNDSLLFVFFVKQSKVTENIKLIGVYILIDKLGNPDLNMAYTDNKNELNHIRSMIGKLPKFTPPIKDGDSVSTTFLIEVPIYK